MQRAASLPVHEITQKPPKRASCPEVPRVSGMKRVRGSVESSVGRLGQRRVTTRTCHLTGHL